MDKKLIEEFIIREQAFTQKVREILLLNHVILETSFCKNCTYKMWISYNYFAEKHNLKKLSEDFLMVPAWLTAAHWVYGLVKNSIQNLV